MLQSSVVLRWVPRYFTRASKSKSHRVSHNSQLTKNKVIIDKSENSQIIIKDKKKQEKEKEEIDVGIKFSFFVNKEKETLSSSSSSSSLKVNSNITDIMCIVLEKAEKLLHSWKEINNLEEKVYNFDIKDNAFNNIRQKKKNAILFTVNTEIFSVLKTILPPAQRSEENFIRCGNNNNNNNNNKEEKKLLSHRLTVIPDEFITDAESYLKKVNGCRVKIEEKSEVNIIGDKHHNTSIIFSLKEILIFLQLYHAVECEDGVLLLQLMQQVRYIVLELQKNNLNNSNNKIFSIKDKYGIIPQLIFTFSSIGIIEESVLKQIINSRSLGVSFLSSKQISYYKENDLINLLIAFHRFGLHHESCFKATVKTLRQRSLRNPLKSFQRFFLTLNYNHNKHSENNNNNNNNNNNMIPTSLSEFTVNELLEALTSIALSLYREESVVNLLIATIIAKVQEEEEKYHNIIINNNINNNNNNKEEKLVALFRTRQVHRAVHICEGMGLPSTRLAFLLEKLARNHGGLLLEKENINEISPERVGFFDAITADLVKVNRS